MARYIDIDKMCEYQCPEAWKSGENCPDEGCAECFYNNGGAEDVAPVIHAEWKKDSIWKKRPDGRMVCFHSVSCSNCNTLFDNESNYCPNCGAKMDKE